MGRSEHTRAAGIRPALITAVVGSAMAGLVHVAAVRNHQGDLTLSRMFAACAAAQLGWAVLAVARPRRAVLAAGIAINAGAVVVWALTRTVGLPVVDRLASPEEVGPPDLGAALFAGAAALGAAVVLLRPVARAVLTPAWSGALAVVGLLAGLPALTADHHHEDEGDHVHVSSAAHEHAADAVHDHSPTGATGHAHEGEPAAAHEEHDTAAGEDPEGHGHAADPAAPADHGHGATEPDVGHEHPVESPTHEHPTSPTAPPHHPPAPQPPIISLDDPRLTPAQRATAVRLIDEMKAALAAYPTIGSIEAAGYESIGDGGTEGYEHYVNWSYLVDGIELDPRRVESIVVKKHGDGTKTIVSGMYILTLGKTMAQVPALAGTLTTWHDHDNLCFDGHRLVDIAEGGVCERGVLTPTPPMLHVWIVEHPCGPFAGIDEHGVDCGAHGH